MQISMLSLFSHRLFSMPNRLSPRPLDYLKSSGVMPLDMTIHAIDMVRYLSDSEVEEVYAVGAMMVDPALVRLVISTAQSPL